MKVVTWLGTRPEIIRLSRVIPLLDAHCEHRLVHTGQNFDPALSDVFFRDLGLRDPDEHLGIVAPSFGAQAGAILERSYDYLSRERPDRLLILGDTNSGLAAVSAARLRIPVFHMEAGNRSFDDRVPEEINRRVIDHCSTVLMPYTQRSKEHLLAEGIERKRIAVIGNPIFEVLAFHAAQIEACDAVARMGLEEDRFFLATLHRAENVDEAGRLAQFIDSLTRVSARFDVPLVLSVHPRTRQRLDASGIVESGRLRFVPPLGFFDFVRLEKSAACVLSDSGTVQEECCIFGVPNVTLRDVTERAETIECGSNILTGAGADDIERAVSIAMATGRGWTPPEEYTRSDVSRTVAKIVLGYGI